MTLRALSIFETAWLSASSAMKVGLRDRTVALLAGLFFAMVLVSAYRGWSATATVNAIYTKAVPVLEAKGLAVPPNPVGHTPPLTLLRNMVTYVALLGALAALMLGHQVVAADRKAGVIPLFFSRPVSRTGLALGKITAVVLAIAAVLLSAGLINVLTMLILPGLSLGGQIWVGVLTFYCVSALYMLAFGLMGATCAAAFSSESMALLIPVTIWLAFTFIVPLNSPQT